MYQTSSEYYVHYLTENKMIRLNMKKLSNRKGAFDMVQTEATIRNQDDEVRTNQVRETCLWSSGIRLLRPMPAEKLNRCGEQD
jgi:hypothetical protein